MRAKVEFCGYCGARFDAAQDYPIQCGSCGMKTYKNPIPVAVAMIPIEGERGLITIRRDIEPAKGLLALPGGFVDWADESWQEATAREVREEIGCDVSAEAIRAFDVVSAPGKKVLIFGICEHVSYDVVRQFTPTDETSELVVIHEPVELGFPIHTQVVARYFE